MRRFIQASPRTGALWSSGLSGVWAVAAAKRRTSLQSLPASLLSSVRHSNVSGTGHPLAGRVPFFSGMAHDPQAGAPCALQFLQVTCECAFSMSERELTRQAGLGVCAPLAYPRLISGGRRVRRPQPAGEVGLRDAGEVVQHEPDVAVLVHGLGGGGGTLSVTSNLPDAGSLTALVANGGGTIRTECGERVIECEAYVQKIPAPPWKRGHRDLFIVARTDALAERFGGVIAARFPARGSGLSTSSYHSGRRRQASRRPRTYGLQAVAISVCCRHFRQPRCGGLDDRQRDGSASHGPAERRLRAGDEGQLLRRPRSARRTSAARRSSPVRVACSSRRIFQYT